jgi:hypothetical protein
VDRSVERCKSYTQRCCGTDARKNRGPSEPTSLSAAGSEVQVNAELDRGAARRDDARVVTIANARGGTKELATPMSSGWSAHHCSEPQLDDPTSVMVIQLG